LLAVDSYRCEFIEQADPGAHVRDALARFELCHLVAEILVVVHRHRRARAEFQAIDAIVPVQAEEAGVVHVGKDRGARQGQHVAGLDCWTCDRPSLTGSASVAALTGENAKEIAAARTVAWQVFINVFKSFSFFQLTA
jgi:hypothetical protein